LVFVDCPLVLLALEPLVPVAPLLAPTLLTPLPLAVPLELLLVPLAPELELDAELDVEVPATAVAPELPTDEAETEVERFEQLELQPTRSDIPSIVRQAIRGPPEMSDRKGATKIQRNNSASEDQKAAGVCPPETPPPRSR
jgi:hypothetical protein